VVPVAHDPVPFAEENCGQGLGGVPTGTHPVRKELAWNPKKQQHWSLRTAGSGLPVLQGLFPLWDEFPGHTSDAAVTQRVALEFA